MDEAKIDRIIEDLVADYDRRDGCLSKSHVERLVEKRQLCIEENTEVYRQLETLGITLEDDQEDPADASLANIDGREIVEPASIEPRQRLGVHLKEMAIRRLTFDEEIDLGRRMELGRRAQRELEGGVPASSEHTSIIERADRARELMIRANLRLVLHIARPYVGVSDLSIDDLFQEGTIGLIRAVEKYDHTLGHHFATYASWWIRSCIARALAVRGATIRLPVNVKLDVARLWRAHKLLSQIHPDRRPGIGELSDELAWPIEKVLFIQHAASLMPVSWEESQPGPASISLMDIVASTQDSPENHVNQKELASHVKETLQGLKGREREVLGRRFGLGGYAEATLEEIGKLFEVTRERIRQIEAKALGRLRHPSRATRLRDFLDSRERHSSVLRITGHGQGAASASTPGKKS